MGAVTTHVLDTSLGSRPRACRCGWGRPRRSSPESLAPAYPEV
jgi:hypothetical protein